MRINLKCIGAGTKGGILENLKTGKREEIKIYHAEFAVIQDKATLLSGKLELTSPKPFSFYPKVLNKYTIVLDTDSGLVVLNKAEGEA